MQMKHDLEAFSRDIVTLIKTSGDTGGSGDKSQKSLRENGFSVPTHRAVVSPLASDWGQDIAASGDRKSEHLQFVEARVPSVPTATTKFREGLADGGEDRAPGNWHAILAELEQQSCPVWMPPDRWSHVLSDTENFLTCWGSTAHSLGWTALDFFGVHPAAPAARFDVMGLLLLTQGGMVAVLTADAATIRRPAGSLLTYRRSVTAGAVLLSRVQS